MGTTIAGPVCPNVYNGILVSVLNSTPRCLECKGVKYVSGFKRGQVTTDRISSIEIKKGAAPVDSFPEEQLSTQCELQGVLALLAMIETLLRRRERGSIETGCDSDTALKGIRTWLYKTNTTREMLGGVNTNLIRDITTQ